MSNPALGIAETIQTASIRRHPSPRHDLNPSTAASKKEPVEAADSDTASISTDVVDPSRMIRPVARRPQLPPLPDLRFEQSYLASLNGAETWQRIAWITVRDQVRARACLRSISIDDPCELITDFSITGSPPSDTGHPLDAGSHGLEVLESQRTAPRQHSRHQDTEMVVQREQVGDPSFSEGAEGSQTGRQGRGCES